MLRYLSVCSGVEAASVAWHPLGWQAVGFSEIESFPAAVLAHHYPTVPNFGDLTKHETWNLAPGSIDLLVGGTPCQAFSVAGKRAGLDDPRGQLMLAYLDLAGRLRPQWIVWENVPGVLSSNGGRDFGAFLGGLEHLGYGWAYRVLDAQWVRTQRHPRAVPQRRRRVFVVGCLGDATSAAAVLFERESVQRNPAKGAKARQGAAADARSGAEGGGRQWPAEVTCTLNTMYSTKLGLEDQHALHGAPAFVLGEKPSVIWREGDQANAAHCVDFAGTLNCDKGQQGGIIAQPVNAEVAPTLDASYHKGPGMRAGQERTFVAQPVNPAVATTLSARDHKGPSCGRDGVVGNPVVVDAPQQPYVIDRAAFNQGANAQYDIRIEEGDAMSALVARGPHAIAHTQAVAYPLQDGRELDKRQNGLGIGDANDPAYTVDCTGAQAVAHAQPVAIPINGMTLNKELRDKQMTGIGDNGDPMFTIRADGTQHAIAHAQPVNAEVAPTLDASYHKGPGMRAGQERTFVAQPVAFEPEPIAFHHNAQACQLPSQLRDTRVTDTLTVSQNAAVATSLAVRRLTPRECERLQGFPDDYTAIAYRNKPAADGPRYKAMGNSMAVNCMAWIGERIAAVNARIR